MSYMMALNWHDAEVCEVSVAVQMTGVVPTRYVEALLGEQMVLARATWSPP